MYGTAMNHVITAKYKKDGAESESIQFTNGMQAVTTGLGTYGLSVKRIGKFLYDNRYTEQCDNGCTELYIYGDRYE